MLMNPVGAFGGLDDTVFDGSDIYKGVMVDIVDLHFVEDVGGVLVGSVFCGLEDDGEPGRVGASPFLWPPAEEVSSSAIALCFL